MMMPNEQEPEFYAMFAELRSFLLELRGRHGGGSKAAADSMMALCLMVARVCLDEGLSASIASEYIRSFTGFLGSVDGGESTRPLGGIVGKGSN